MTIWLVTKTPTGREPKNPVAHAFDKDRVMRRCFLTEPDGALRRTIKPGDGYCQRCTESPNR